MSQKPIIDEILQTATARTGARSLARLAGAVGRDVTGWTVRAALVVDRPLAGAHLRRLAVPVWTSWELPGKPEQ